MLINGRRREFLQKSDTIDTFEFSTSIDETARYTNESSITDESSEANSDNKTLNPAAWVDQYGDYLYRYAVSRLRDGEAAEEVVQETFVAALRHVEQYEAKGSERAWLLGILKRKIIDLYRFRMDSHGNIARRHSLINPRVRGDRRAAKKSWRADPHRAVSRGRN